jgi:hypothetical protein
MSTIEIILWFLCGLLFGAIIGIEFIVWMLVCHQPLRYKNKTYHLIEDTVSKENDNA